MVSSASSPCHAHHNVDGWMDDDVSDARREAVRHKLTPGLEAHNLKLVHNKVISGFRSPADLRADSLATVPPTPLFLCSWYIS
ncbi:hypothetical protein PoB_006545500 [Plakobranchus ocellatus]|uniref:Uncharacterized protein n=1 Tax=Plakobranchus ocellatus TaxID=259542 RepID=A0AAV4D482_9GAST|nr:hypothetical protein PoB_006545500 [Plakobranchus ocellatus]